MKISQEEVRYVANLARLEMNDEEVERMTDQLDTFLSYVTKLEEVDTSGIAVTTHTQQVINAFREDIVQPSLPVEKALANAPQSNESTFIVPRII